jgi:peptidoglycan hydrolase CwlO-like protein
VSDYSSWTTLALETRHRNLQEQINAANAEAMKLMNQGRKGKPEWEEMARRAKRLQGELADLDKELMLRRRSGR